MDEINKKIGSLVAKVAGMYLGKMQGIEKVQEELSSGNFSADQQKKIREIIEKEGPIGGIAAAVTKAYSPELGEKVKKAMESGAYSTVIALVQRADQSRIVADIERDLQNTGNSYAEDPKKVAEALCGAMLTYKGKQGTIGGIISRTEAWTEVGGEDQTFPKAEPGTIGVYHSNKMGGYDVALIVAHTPGSTGIVTITGMRLVNDKKKIVGKEITGKTAIVEQWGFNDKRIYEKMIQTPGIPLQITNDRLLAYGGIDTVIEEKEGLNDKLVAKYVLKKAAHDLP